jgi:predicted phage terminase large subunit-like protein
MQQRNPRELAALAYDWGFWGRPKQFWPKSVPGVRSIRVLAAITGRGFGKTKMGAERIRRRVTRRARSFAMLIGPTFTAVRDTMLEGESGLLACFPYWDRPKYYPSRLRLVLKNGSIVQGYSADNPDSIRGPNVTDIWGDEFCAWEDVKAYKNAQMCLRSGVGTKMMLTSTPNFSLLCDALFEDAERRPDRIKIIGGSTYENASNLDPDFIEDIGIFKDTEYGDQEIFGLRLIQGRGALWSEDIIHEVPADELPTMVKRALFVDSASSDNKDSDETGIIVLGQAVDRRVYVLDDFTVQGGDPVKYLAAMKEAKDKWKLDTVLAERNDGGLALLHTIKNAGHGWRYVLDIYNTKTKRLRAQPVVPLCQKKMVMFLKSDRLKKLRKQMLTSPIGQSHAPDDRVDAMILGVHHFLPHLVKLQLPTTSVISEQGILKKELLKNVA